MSRGGPTTGPPRFAFVADPQRNSADHGPTVPPIQEDQAGADVRTMHSPVLRRLLAPLGAMLAIAAAAGYLVTTQAPARAAVEVPPSPLASLAPVAATLGGVAAGQGRISTPSAVKRPAAQRKTYRFLLMQPDKVTPIRWNPCRPVRYRIALNGAVPASEIPRIDTAFRIVGNALGGVTFVNDGRTTVVPDAVDDAGTSGADIVVAFALPGDGPTRSTLLTGWEAGRGGFAASGTAGPDGVVVEHPTHGSVVIDAEKWQAMTRHDRAVLYLHEIGHVVGLDHPADPRQIMSSGAYDLPVRYQKGDLEALAQLGLKAGCTR
jgi:hypothetical protein